MPCFGAKLRCLAEFVQLLCNQESDGIWDRFPSSDGFRSTSTPWVFAVISFFLSQ